MDVIQDLIYYDIVFVDGNNNKQHMILYFNEEKTDEEILAYCQDNGMDISTLVATLKQNTYSQEIANEFIETHG